MTLTCQGIGLSFGKQEVLTDINLVIKKGDFVALIGENGSGKTSLVKMMLGLIPPTYGTLTNSFKPIGYLSQKVAVQDKFFPATVEEVVSMGLLSRQTFPRLLTPKNKLEITSVLTFLDLLPFRKTKIGLLSGGQQQRALLARALVNHPELLILDEPTSALDPAMRHALLQWLKELQRSGITILLVTHDVASVGEVATRIVYLEQKIIFDGTFNQFCEHPTLSPYIHRHGVKHR